jgi:DNA polymerase-3 subunit delta'
MQFRQIPGLSELKAQLVQNAKAGRIPHAQLFLGPEGSANLALAWAFARYIACENKQADDSCGICGSCNKISKIIHPDLHFSFPSTGEKGLSSEYMPQWREALVNHPYLNVYDWLQLLEKENKQGNITAAECRDIIRKLSLRSFESEHKFLILWMPEYLGKEGNTLLKIIEEPPANTVFLLVASNQEAIIPTILSRTQIVKVPRFTDTEISDFLVRAQGVGQEQAAAISFLAEGNLNLALRLLEDTDPGYFSSFRTWLQAAYSGKVADLSAWAEASARLGRENQKHLLEYGIRMLRECLLFRQGVPELIRVQAEEKEFVRKFSAISREDQLVDMIRLLNDYAYFIERNANPRIALFNLSLRFKNILSSSKN